MFVLLEGGTVFDPDPRGPASVLLAADRIAQVGPVDGRALEAAGLPLEVVDARGCLVLPGLVDPHEHLIGGSGERGFSSQTPEIAPRELAEAGITTVVGCLGVDTTTRTMAALLAKAKGLREEGFSAYLWSGGYDVPPRTLTGSLRTDLLFLEEVIGAGEIAISDPRATAPTIPELARLVSDAYVGGLLSGKAGITHFHVGDGPGRLLPLRRLLEEHDVEPAWLYPTHVERNAPLLQEAAALSRRGCFVDVDVVEEDLPLQLRSFLEQGGDASRLTISSDAAVPSPRTLFEQVRAAVREHGFELSLVLSLCTRNPARALQLERKGRVQPGADADVIVIEEAGFELRDVFARGRRVLREGRPSFVERFLEQSNRRIELHGGKRR